MEPSLGKIAQSGSDVFIASLRRFVKFTFFGKCECTGTLWFPAAAGVSFSRVS
jgi:hypothetical protein